MTSADSTEDLIDSVLALPRAERRTVLGQLTPAARQRLLPILQQAERKDFSGSLKDLIDVAADGRIPSGMTASGAAALLRAYEADATLLQAGQVGGHGGMPMAIATLRNLLGLRR